MELVKSKGLVVFIVVGLIITIVGSTNTKKYDENSKISNESYISMNIK